MKVIVPLALLLLSLLILFWIGLSPALDHPLVNPTVYAQDDDEEEDEEDEADDSLDNCPIGALFDEVPLTDGCIERRFYQAAIYGGCQVSQPILSCPASSVETTTCDPDNTWSIVAAGCDSTGFFYEVRYNLCTGLIEPYYNPRLVVGLCSQPRDTSCQTDEQFNNFLGCQQSKCGVAIYACDSDRKQQREYDDGGSYCFQSQFNQACAELEEKEEDEDDEEEDQLSVTPSPVTSSTRPIIATSPPPTSPSTPRPLSSPSPIFDLTARVKGKVVDLKKLEIEPGQPITLTVQTPNRSPQDSICQWRLDNLVNETGQPVIVQTSCSLTETFHPDSLNLGVVQVSAKVVDKNSHQIVGQVKTVKFKVKDPNPDNSCLSGEDPQIIKQCIIKQSRLEKEPKSGQPLSSLMLCLLDQEGVPSLLGSQPTTTNTLFEQVSLAKQAILRGETTSWASYPLCLNR